MALIEMTSSEPTASSDPLTPGKNKGRLNKKFRI